MESQCLKVQSDYYQLNKESRPKIFGKGTEKHVVLQSLEPEVGIVHPFAEPPSSDHRLPDHGRVFGIFTYLHGPSELFRHRESL
jgi:hypothetical protein